MEIGRIRPGPVPKLLPPVRPKSSPAPDSVQLSPALEIRGAERLTAETVERLSSSVARARDLFEQHFGPVAGALQVDVRKEQPALRTGYNFADDVICFPPSAAVKNGGLDSPDVIHHEVFHALLVKRFPHTKAHAQTDDGTILHEALADFFAYQLSPDNRFGENFYSHKEQIRFYRNELRFNLAAGVYGKANALTSHLVNSGVELSQLKSFLESQDFTLGALTQVSPDLQERVSEDLAVSLNDQVVAYPPSHLRRYRIKSDEDLRLRFVANPELQVAHPGLKIKWADLAGLPSKSYQIEQAGPGEFLVRPRPEAESEKLLALFYDGDRLLGSRPFYFSPQRDKD